MRYRNWIPLAGVLALALGSAPALQAGHKTYVPAEEVRANTDKVLSEIEWSDTLEAVKERAKKERKLVFWLQIVGELDGGL